MNRIRSLLESDRWIAVLFLGPALLLILGLMIYPLAYSLILSFQDYDIIHPAEFVGLQNFIKMFSDSTLGNSLKVTLSFTAVTFGLQFVIGLGLALLLNELPMGRNSIRTGMMIPYLLSPVAVAVTWRIMLNYDFGIINYGMNLLGLPNQGWTIDPATALPTLIGVEVWHTTSLAMLLFSAGIAALPREVFEMARIDGAHGWTMLRYITLPQLKPVMLVLCLFRSYDLLRTFDKAFMLTGGGPGRITETLVVYIYNLMFRGWNVGYAAALCYLLFGISLVISLILIRALGLGQESK